MKIFEYPERTDWGSILKRPLLNISMIEETVGKILEEVRQRGDEAVRKFTLQFDKAEVGALQVTESEINEAERLLSRELKQAICRAKENIQKFHAVQKVPEPIVETMPGVQCWRKSVPIEKVGLYIPGGSAPLFSTVLMLGIPAALADCREVVLCSPPDTSGQLNPAILFAAKISGITKIFRVGGVQAIGAMSYGTESIPQVYKIFGPGNQYVTCAKLLVQREGIAIDLPAGPSEVAVYADETANPAFLAADLLSQAEHGIDSQTLLITSQPSMISQIIDEIDRQVADMPRKNIALKALEHGMIILVRNEEEAIDLLNEYAVEHLIIACADADGFAARIVNAGSVFLGKYSPEAAGDYASGTNHTLPTNGWAKSYSGVSVDSFVKKISFQRLTEEGLKNIAGTVQAMAAAEGLSGHANAVGIRMVSGEL